MEEEKENIRKEIKQYSSKNTNMKYITIFGTLFIISLLIKIILKNNILLAPAIMFLAMFIIFIIKQNKYNKKGKRNRK